MTRSDLFDRADLDEATAAAAQARVMREEARRRAQVAPHGEVAVRRARLAEATQRALEAELVLARIRQAMR